jgi:NADH-quinone oxidoreductase subunit E
MQQVIEQILGDVEQTLTAAEIAAIEHEASHLERRDAAGIEALRIVQAQRGWISDASLYAIANLLAMPVADLEGVATFYNLIYRQPVGRYVIHICDSIACHLTGYADVLSAIKTELDIEYGQTSSDGLFTLLSNACLGACDQAPVMMIGKTYYQQLTPQTALQILKQLTQQASTEQGQSGQGAGNE